MTTYAQTAYAERVLADIDRLTASDLELQPNTRKLLRVLREHVGSENAVSRAELGCHLGERDRAVRALIHDLRECYGIAIGSSRKPGSSGYYIISNAGEARELTMLLFAQARTLLRTARKLGGRHETEKWFTETKAALDLDQEEVRAAA